MKMLAINYVKETYLLTRSGAKVHVLFLANRY